MQVWPDGWTTNKKWNWKENKINNFWFCFHSLFGKLKIKNKFKKKCLSCDWIREKQFVYYLGKDCFGEEKLVYQKNNILFFPFGKGYPFIKRKKNGKNLCLEKPFLKEINLIQITL